MTQGVAHWKKFFNDHKSYVKVGRVNHPPIDPASPLPVHCEPKKEAEQRARWGTGPPPLAAQQEKRVGEEKEKEEGAGVGVGVGTEAGGRHGGPAAHAHEEL